jgi:two-component system phosphate regulon sensor histidine kinase PhoR
VKNLTVKFGTTLRERGKKLRKSIRRVTENSLILFRLLVPLSVHIRLWIIVVLILAFQAVLEPFVPTLVLLSLCAAIAFLALVRLVDLPLRALQQLTRQGGFDLTDTLAPILGHDEYSRLARAIQGMGRRMNTSIQEAREQNSRIDEIFSAIGEGVVLCTMEGKILKINHTVRRWLEYYGDPTGRDFIEVIRSVELNDRFLVFLQQCRKHEILGTIEPEVVESIHLDGPEAKRVRAKMVPVQSGNQHPVCFIFLFDLSDLHRLEQFRREFFANVSHELKTPIASIRGYAELLQDQLSQLPPETIQQFLTVIMRNSEQVSTLLQDMILLSNLENGQIPLTIKPYDIGLALARVRETLAPKAKEAGVSVVVDVPSTVQELFVDGQRFDSVLLNLVDNGIKYNRKGGYVKVSVRQSDDDWTIYVEDSGLGMPHSAQLRAFERFYRVDKSHTRLGGGTGLGLAIVKHVIQAHGGQINLRSEPSTGTVFTLVIPRKRTQARIGAYAPF